MHDKTIDGVLPARMLPKGEQMMPGMPKANASFMLQVLLRIWLAAPEMLLHRIVKRDVAVAFKIGQEAGKCQ